MIQLEIGPTLQFCKTQGVEQMFCFVEEYIRNQNILRSCICFWQKQVGSNTSTERGEIMTAVMGMSAIGHHVPSFLIFPRPRLSGTFFVQEQVCRVILPGIDVFSTCYDHFSQNIHHALIVQRAFIADEKLSSARKSPRLHHSSSKLQK